MADVTMVEAAKYSQSALPRAVTKIIVESSPILEDIPWKTISGSVYRYNREGSLGDIGFRGVNGTWTKSVGIINAEFEPLVIMGGELTIDNFQIKTSNLMDIKASKYRMKSRAVGIKFSETFFEGDTSIDPYSFDGLRKRLTGAQKQLMATGGGTLTLAKLDRLIASVIGSPSQKVLYMNETLAMKITDLARAQTGTTVINMTPDQFNAQFTAYAGVPIKIVKREDTGSTILDFDEDPGDGVSDTASIYCVRYGEDFVHGIQAMSLPDVKDFGEVEAGPYHLGRIEWYLGIAIEHPRSAARLYGITNT